MKENKIILKSKTPSECIGMIRLTSEAEQIVRELSQKTSIPIRQVASEIVIQASRFIAIEQDGEIENWR